jgi:hypothetical protein
VIGYYYTYGYIINNFIRKKYIPVFPYKPKYVRCCNFMKHLLKTGHRLLFLESFSLTNHDHSCWESFCTSTQRAAGCAYGYILGSLNTILHTGKTKIRIFERKMRPKMDIYIITHKYLFDVRNKMCYVMNIQSPWWNTQISICFQILWQLTTTMSSEPHMLPTYTSL